MYRIIDSRELGTMHRTSVRYADTTTATTPEVLLGTGPRFKYIEDFVEGCLERYFFSVGDAGIEPATSAV